ncbi:NIPSNAP family protein [Actinophytocola sp.]|uniref:NIPSNAP family protein n=1 Tax=Actinophytocola sp. TaxID=1872138 RepID=UPI002D81011C|nr:NIPSNAP family protein [Actinophytocola sp.]HET9138631.1 NIPSNAP family protein [Actinophytocola sp.]
MNDIYELRQYTLRPGQRDVLIELFDREFVESQEELGIRVVGQFRDLERPDRFVWVRGFPSMAVRAESLTAFYGGPVWRAHRAAANATMIDSDDVLLLRPAGGEFTLNPAVRGTPASTVVVADIRYLSGPYDGEFARIVDDAAVALSTEYAENNFPALPVRTGEHVFVTFASVPAENGWPEPAGLPEHAKVTRRERLLLAPTDRSMLR